MLQWSSLVLRTNMRLDALAVMLRYRELLKVDIDQAWRLSRRRRLATAREADPIKRREETARRDLIRIRKNIDRLLTAYQEGLLSLDELRERMPQLRQRQRADNAELQAIVNQSVDRATCLRLAETLTTFLTRLRSSADALDISERQRVARLLVKEILVGDDQILIRHCIPLPTEPIDSPAAGRVNAALPSTPGYLLRSRSHG